MSEAVGRSPRILIAGGGMVGGALALALTGALPAGARITVIERGAPPRGPQEAAGGSFDARSTALSEGSRAILARLGLWEAISRELCPIEHIHVSNRGRPGSALLRAADYGWPALGYVVENLWLGRALSARLAASSDVDIRYETRALRARVERSGVTLDLESAEGEASLEADLLVLADGAGSPLREALGMGSRRRRYGQHAVVANLAMAQPHRGLAFERFTESGPLALLPLPAAPDAQHRASLVWSLPPEEASRLRDVGEAEFLRTLQRHFGYRLGRLKRVGVRATYPLERVEAREPVRRRVVAVGNAAHALHPVAGQGFNLALRDIDRLAHVLAAGIAAGSDPGDLALLRTYQDQRDADQQRTLRLSDGLPDLFAHRGLLLGASRDLALVGLDITPALKRSFVAVSAGMPGHG